tara:strand:- start:658 stop:915 length:258 start_codon:yes stop_codon:yes gene_type:complete
MNYNNRHYMTLPFSSVTEDMMDAAMESSFDTLRHSVEGEGADRVVLKYEGERPAVFNGITTYTHAEILEIMSGPDWTPPNPQPPS